MIAEDIITMNMDWMLRVAKWYCCNEEDAKDIVGDAVYNMLRHRERFAEVHNFKPWARTIIHNLYLNRSRRNRYCPTIPYEEYCVAASEAADDAMSLKGVVGALRRVNRRYVSVECVILHAKGYSYDEIADRLCISTGTVKSRINTGRSIIRKALKW